MSSTYKGFSIGYGSYGVYAFLNSYDGFDHPYLCNDLVLRKVSNGYDIEAYYFSDEDLARGSIDKYRETHEKPI